MSGPDMNNIKEVINNLEQHGMSYWIPRPAYLSNSFYSENAQRPAWYTWSLEHWGCKWDISYAEVIDLVDEEKEKYGIIHFNSANSSIVPFVHFLKGLFPEYSFDLEYIDIDDDPEQMYYYKA